MNKNRVCTVFPNCNKLQEKFMVPLPTLYSYIRTYNDYARRNELRTIQPDVTYSEEELQDIYNRISEYRVKRLKDSNFDRKERKSLAKSFGSFESYAISIVQSTNLTGSDINILRNEITQAFVQILSSFCDQYKMSPEDVLRKYGTQSIFNAVKNAFQSKILNNFKELKNADALNIDEARKEELRESINMGKKFLPLGNPNGVDVFNELCILSIPLINSVFDIKIQSDMSVSGQNLENNEDALVITDDENPIRERWQESLDTKPAEGSVSSIIRRILLNTPRMELVPTTEYYLNGKKVDDINSVSEDDINKITPRTSIKRQVVRGKILGQPMFSDPSWEATKLFRILENVTEEDELIDVLKSQDQYKELASYLNEHPRERTTFLADFNKYFQEISAVSIVDKGDGTFRIMSPTLNIGSKTDYLRDYLGDLTYNRINDNSFYRAKSSQIKNEDGVTISRKVTVDVNYKKFSIEKLWFEKNFLGTEDNPSTIKKMIDAGKYEGATNMLVTALSKLNINVDLAVANEIISNESSLNVLISNISDFYNEGEQAFLRARNALAGNVVKLIDNNEKLSSALYNIVKLTSASDVLSSKAKNMVDFGGGRTSSRILPSAITNFIKKLHKFDYRDKEKRLENEGYVKEYIQNWLERTYLNGDQYMTNDGIITNRWLKDLYDAAEVQSGAGSIRDYFGLSRNLGIDNVKFEKISDRAHMLSFLYSYLRNRKYQYGEEIPAKVDNNGRILLYNEETKQFNIPAVNTKGKTFAIVDSIKTISFDKHNNKKEGFRSDVAMIPLFITGDTNQLRLFKTMNYHESEILDGMYNLYLSDLTTQGVIKGLDSKGIVVSSNGKESLTKKGNDSKFGIIEFLNYKQYHDMLEEKQVDGVVSKEDFIDIARTYLNNEFEHFYSSQLKRLGLLSKNADGKLVYFDDFLDELTKDDKEEKLKEILKDFYFNYKFGSYNQIQLNHVTALAFNGTKDAQKRNKVVGTNGTPLSSQTEINGKRLFPKDNFAQKVVYFKDVFGAMRKSTSDALKTFLTKEYKPIYGDKAEERAEEFVSKFDKNSLTDGEAYRLLDSYRAILASAGKNFWSDEQEAAYRTISSITAAIRLEHRNATVEEIQEIEDKLVTFQPIKPVNDGIETYVCGDTTVKMGFQFKYAEVPLIPELYPIGSKLRQMGEWMYNNGVNMMCSDKCLKKGSFGEVDIQFKAVNGQYVDKDGNVLPGYDMNGKLVDNPTMAQQRRYINANPKEDNRVEYDDETSFEDIINNQALRAEDGSFGGFVIHNIPFDNYLIQTNVPDHSGGKVILGTQPRKHIGANIKDNETYSFTVNGKKIDVKGDKLIKIYNALHAAKYMKSFVSFMNMMKDKQLLSRNLAYSISSNDRSNLNLLERIALDNNGNPIIPYSEISNERDLMNTVISMFKKRVIRQEISGGNIVQASSMGVGKKALQDPDLQATRNADGVIDGMEAETPFFFTVKSEDGFDVKLKYEDFCFDDGTFKPGENGGETLIEEKYPGILDLVMYRIPTEGLYSMYHVHIKRVTPKTSANTIKLPAECTTISDFDFDIDKLMFMMRTYRAIPQKIVHVEGGIDSAVWKQIYDEHSADVYMKLRQYAEGAGWYKYLETGDKKHLSKEIIDLAKERNIDIKDLRLNYFWDLAGIIQSKQSIYDNYAQQYIKDAHVEGSTYEFDENTDFMKLSMDAIDNAIVDISQAVLSHSSTLEGRFTSGGFAIMSNDARILRLLKHKEALPGWADRNIETDEDLQEFIKDANDNSNVDYEEDHDFSDPMTSLLFKQQNQIAGEEIGIFANDNINHAIDKRLKTFKIKNPADAILFGRLINKDVDFEGDESRELIGQSFLFRSMDGRLIDKTMEELLGSSVDAVKDNALVDINLNFVTGDLGAMLARLGYSTFDIGLLFNQPIVKKVCEEMALTGERNVTKVLRKIVKEYSKDPKVLSKKINKEYVTSANLAKNYINGGDNITQINVARLFNKICQVKQDVSKHVQKTRNTSANTVKVDIGKYLSNFAKNSNSKFDVVTIQANDELEDPITNEAIDENWANLSPEKLLEKMKQFIGKYMDHPYTYENAVYNIINASMQFILQKYTPYLSPQYERSREILAEYMAPWGLSGEYINQLHSFIPALQLVEMDGDFNPNSTNNPLGITNKEYYLQYIYELIGELGEINPDILNNNEFLSAFSTQQVEKREDSEVLVFKYKNNLSQWEKFGFTMAWDDLMKLGGKYAELGKALYLHSYYVNGFNPSTNRLMELAPVSVLSSLVADKNGDISYLDIYQQDNNIITDDVIRDRMIKFMLYHSNDNKVVPTMPWHLKDLTLDGAMIQLSGDKLEDVKMAPKGKFGYYVRPIIKVDGAIYVISQGLNKDAEYEIGNTVYNIISSKDKVVTYVRLKSTPVDYSRYITGNNGYIFGDIQSMDIQTSEDEEDDLRAEEESGDDVAEAVAEAREKAEEPDSTGVLGC